MALRLRDPVEYLAHARRGVLAHEQVERLGGGRMVDGDAHAVGQQAPLHGDVGHEDRHRSGFGKTREDLAIFLDHEVRMRHEPSVHVVPDANVFEQEKVNAVDIVEGDARTFSERVVGRHGDGKRLGHEPCVRYQTIFLANVTFEPGCRNNWHIHHADKGGGQILLCTDGRGWCQFWGEDARELHPGDVVFIPAGVKHWHGAAKDSWFSHVAFEAPGEGCSNEWLGPVADAEYDLLP